MRDATDDEVEQIAQEIAESVVTNHVRGFFESNIPETAHYTNATFRDGEHLEFTSVQREALTEAAISGLVEGLREFDAEEQIP